MSDAAPVIRLDNIVRAYATPDAPPLEVLRGASLTIARGELVALVAPSGAGKSTLLHVAGLLERPDGGDVLVGGRSCGGMNDDARTAVRRNEIGFVYQFHHLLPEFSALENIVLPQMIADVPRKIARERAGELLQRMGLIERAGHHPGKLSGGEQQRVAIARAIANGPLALLADEPTGNLDHQTADNVFAQLLELVRVAGIGALVATHNLELAERMDRTLHIQDGKISE